MKVSKIPGLGRFGVYIDDLDFNNITDEEWAEVGKIHLNSLVTIIRNVDVSVNQYERRIRQWGTPHNGPINRLALKYKIRKNALYKLLQVDEMNGIKVDDSDKAYIKHFLNIVAYEATQKTGTAVGKISGIKNEDGTPVGMFADGELLWHSNESGTLVFAPEVSLLGSYGMVGSATGFLTTPDWYESQTESFRSELDEMIINHKFTPGKINPGLRDTQDHIVNRNMCEVPSQLPLVCETTGGIKGLHYSLNTIDSVVGMSQVESQKLFDYINKTLLTDKYIYDHWYKQDNDLLLFDNAVTLHRRLGGIENRMAYRIQYMMDKVGNPEWCPWESSEYKDEFYTHLEALKSTGRA